jgi:hypothetical protein
MSARRFSCCERGVDGYPPYVRGWFCLAESGTMQRGYRDVGYLLAAKLCHFRPRWMSVRAWRYHLHTLASTLEQCDERAAMWWFAATYPGLVTLLPLHDQSEFCSGVRDLLCGS